MRAFRYEEIGMTEADLDDVVGLVMDRDLRAAPRPVEETDVRRILTGALRGVPAAVDAAAVDAGARP